VVAFVVVLASITTYFVMRHELQAQLDGSLRHEVRAVQGDPDAFHGPESFAGHAGKIIGTDGSILAESYPVPIDRPILQVARGHRHGFYRDITVREFGRMVPGREIVAPFASLFSNGAVVFVEPLQQTNHALERLRLILILVSVGAVGIAALLAALVAGAT